MLPRRLLIEAGRYGFLLGGVFILAWAITSVVACARLLAGGQALDWSAVAIFPGSVDDLLTVPIVGSFLLLHCLTPKRRPAMSVLRYELFFALADATGAMAALGTLFSFGFGDWIGQHVEAIEIPSKIGHAPIWSQICLCFLIGSFAGFWGHRLMHTSLLWPLHAMHHAARDLTPLTDSRQHPLDGVIKNVLPAFCVGLAGFDPTAVMATLVLARMQAAFSHSSLPFPLWVERWLVCGPALHRVHHASAAELHHRNFSALVLWDRLFGTFALPENARSLAIGIEDRRHDTGRPLRDILRVTGIWLSGLIPELRRCVGQWRIHTVTRTIVVFLAAIVLRPAMAAEVKSVEAEETQFKVTLADGRVLRSPELIGAVLTIAAGGETMRVRIDGVQRDPDARRGDVWLHTLSVKQADGSWGNLCGAGPDGRRQGFPLAGKARAGDGMFETAPPGIFELTCTSGAQGKCVRYGYFPWDGGGTGLALYNACIRMIRADYCGDGTPHTRDGTLIDIFDKSDIQKDDPAPGLEFEAAWGPNGAICVSHVRIPEIYSLNRLRDECPRLKSENLGNGCTEERMSSNPDALLMNKSTAR